MPIQRETVTVESFYTKHASELQLRLVAGANGLKRIIREPTVNRPGLALSGFNKYFAMKRVQIFGNAEYYYLRSLPPVERAARYDSLFHYAIPCVVISRDLKPDKQFLAAAEKANIPVFQTSLITMKFINTATIALEMMFAPRDTEMGSMVDILGVGVIIKGESGIGKSECVLALLERGYSLVADDITRVQLIDGRDVMGTCSELTRHHMEVRGLGLINVRDLFGVASTRTSKRVELVVQLERWDEAHEYERLGLDEHYHELLGLRVPLIRMPVAPGRNLGTLVEVAARNQLLRARGLNAARTLAARLDARLLVPPGCEDHDREDEDGEAGDLA